MTTKNIFAGVGVRTTFVNIFYDELMKREFVTLPDVMCIKRGKPEGDTIERDVFYQDNIEKAEEFAYPTFLQRN